MTCRRWFRRVETSPLTIQGSLKSPGSPETIPIRIKGILRFMWLVAITGIMKFFCTRFWGGSNKQQMLIADKNFVLGPRPIYQGAFAVSFRECNPLKQHGLVRGPTKLRTFSTGDTTDIAGRFRHSTVSVFLWN